MNIINQKPVVLSPVYSDNIQKDFDVIDILKQIIVTPLFTPVVTTQPVTMTTSNGKPITDDDIADLIIQC